MSNAILPTLPGLAWNIHKRPTFRTRVLRSGGGWETRVPQMMYPTWEFELPYEFLRSAAAYGELQTLMGFYLQRQGSFDSFLYYDPSDNSVTAQLFGIGNGATTAFQLLRTYGGFNEPVQNLSGTPLIYRNDWQGNQLLYATARTNYAFPSADMNGRWIVRGAGSVTYGQPAPDGSSSGVAISVNQVYVNDVYTAGITATTGARYEPSFWIKKTTASGVLALDNPQGGLYGEWLIDFSKLGTGYEHITRSHPAVTIHYEFSGFNNQVGFFFYPSVSGTTLQFTAYAFQFESGITSGSYIPTTTATVTVTDYGIDNTGLVTFQAAPLTGAALTWTGAYYYRVRFAEDNADFNNMMQDLWELKKLNFLGSPMNKV